MLKLSHGTSLFQLIPSSEVFRLKPPLYYDFSTSSEIQLSCFLLLALKIDRISSSWVIHYSVSLLSLPTLVIFKLRGMGEFECQAWKLAGNFEEPRYSKGRNGGEQKVRQINGQTEYTGDCLKGEGCRMWQSPDLRGVRECDHLQICRKIVPVCAGWPTE